MEAISSTCGTKMEIKWISVSPLSAKIVLSSSIKAGKNLNTVSAKQIPDHTEMLTPTTLPDIIYKKWVEGLSGNVIYEFTTRW